MPDPTAPAEVFPETAAVEAPAAAPVVTPPVETTPAAARVDDYAAELRAAAAEARTALTKEEVVETPTDVVPETAAEVVAETEPVVTEPVVTEPVVEEEELHAPERIRLTGLSDRSKLLADAASRLAKAEGIEFDEAMARVAPPKTEAAPVVAQPDPAADELAEIQTALDAHAEAGDLPTPAIRKLQLRESEILAEVAAQRLVAPLKQKEAEREQHSLTTAQTASGEKMKQEAPTAYQKGSPLNLEAQEVYENMQTPGHPDYIPGLDKTSNAAEVVIGRALNSLAQKISARDGISFGDAYAALKGNPISVQQVKTVAPTPTTPAVTAVRKPAVTAPGNVRTAAPDRAKTQPEIEAELAAMDPGQRFEALFGRPLKVG